MLKRLQRRSLEGPRAWPCTLGGGRGPFTVIPPSLQLPLGKCVESSPNSLLSSSILLTYSRCGLYMYSYSFQDSLEELTFELQIWKVLTSPEARSVRGKGVYRPGPPPLALYATCPLFSGVNWFSESSMGCLMEGSKVRVSVWEAADGHCLVATGFLTDGATTTTTTTFGGGSASSSSSSSSSSSISTTISTSAFIASGSSDETASPKRRGRNVHLSIIPLPMASLYPPYHFAGAGASSEAPPASLNALHFSYSLLHPYPLPQPGFFTPCKPPPSSSSSSSSSLSYYRLFLNTGDGVKVLTFGVRPAGIMAVGEGVVGSSPPPPSHPSCATTTTTTTTTTKGPWHSETQGGPALEPLFFSISTSVVDRGDIKALLAGRRLPSAAAAAALSTTSTSTSTSSTAHLGVGFTGLSCSSTRLSLAHGLSVWSNPSDERAWCGAVDPISLASLDVESLLPSVVRGVCRDYDIRLVRVLDGEEGGRGEKGGGGGEGEAWEGRLVSVLVMVDHQLPLNPLPPPPPPPSSSHLLPPTTTSHMPSLSQPGMDEGEEGRTSGRSSSSSSAPFVSPFGPPPPKGVLQNLIQGGGFGVGAGAGSGGVGVGVKRTFGGGEKGRKVGSGGASTASSSHSSLSRSSGSSGSGSSGSGSSGSSGDKLSPVLMPWEFEEGGSPPLPTPHPIRAPTTTTTTTTTATYSVPDTGLSSPVRTRLVFVYDPVSGGVRVLSCLKAPPLFQPGLDSSGALGGEKRSIGTVTGRALAVLREEGGMGGMGGRSSNPRAQVAFSSNDALLRGQSLKVLVNPALPSALVL